eukprot:TRINITY_DN10162_c0_g1_i1.p2 TRINITY_DN10162_c0_g1~~TRINITY_DN10162_c0_g1_i1.p2  ORF type:complete len:242 (+),score=33.92 TRINITY_DN10162_c0_g1_i1:2916-3641(+)
MRSINVLIVCIVLFLTTAKACTLADASAYASGVLGCAIGLTGAASCLNTDCICDSLQSYIRCTNGVVTSNPCVSAASATDFANQLTQFGLESCSLLSQYTLIISTAVPDDFGSMTDAQLEALCIELLDNGNIASVDYTSDDVSIQYVTRSRRRNTNLIYVTLIYRGMVMPATADIENEAITVSYQTTTDVTANGNFTPEDIKMAAKSPGEFNPNDPIGSNTAANVAASLLTALAAFIALLV